MLQPVGTSYGKRGVWQD